MPERGKRGLRPIARSEGTPPTFAWRRGLLPVLDLRRLDRREQAVEFGLGRVAEGEDDQGAGNRVSQVSGSVRVGMMAPKINVSPVQP